MTMKITPAGLDACRGSLLRADLLTRPAAVNGENSISEHGKTPGGCDGTGGFRKRVWKEER